MSPRVFGLALSALVGVPLFAPPSATLAAWPSPTANLSVCTAAGNQARPQSVSDGAGGVILAWVDHRPGAPGIYVQRVSAAGMPLWAADGVRIHSPSLGVVDMQPIEEVNLAVTSDGAGGAIVAWEDTVGDGNTDILGQRINSTGVTLWPPDGVPVCRAPGRQFYPRLAADGAGGAFAAWQDLRDGIYRVYAQHVSASGACSWAPDGQLASDAVEDVQHPYWYTLDMVVTSDELGGAILTWSTTRGLVGQRFDGDGTRLWTSSGAVVCSHRRSEIGARILPDGEHGAFITWFDYRDFGGDIYVQRVDAAGTSLWTADGVLVVGYDSFDSWTVRIASDAQGGCILLWQDTRPYYCSPCNGSVIYAQRFNSSGNAQWTPGGALVSDATRGSGAVNMRVFPEVVPDGSGGAIFAYQLNVGGSTEWPEGPFDIYCQRVGADGTRQWANDVAVCTDPGNQVLPVLVPSGHGAIIAWMDARSGGWDVYAQGVDAGVETITFTDIGAGLPGGEWNSVAWGDYDSDADLDILIGYLVYRNDGGVFTDAHAGLPGAGLSAVAWGDYDNDGDLDIALTGQTGGDPEDTAGIFRNDGAGAFVDIGAGLQGVYHGAVDWGDYDGDGDLDLLLMGIKVTGSRMEPFSAVYRNEGADRFSDIGAAIPGAGQSAAKWGDYDNDGDLDILMSGAGGAGATGLYRNDGAGQFVQVDLGLPQLNFSAVAWGDYDNDGDLDFLLTGSGPTSIIYRNDGAGVFTDIHAGLQGMYFSSVAWGDYDNDGDLDILMSGDLVMGSVALVYRNDGGVFVDAHAGLVGASRQGVAWGDYDQNGDLDILIGSRVYRSDGAPPNTPPAAPDGPWSIDVVWGTVTLSWTPTVDAQTPANGLSYNLRVGTTPGGSEIASAMADPVTGYRRVVQLGDAQQRTSWKFHLPEVASFYWSVQAVDGAFAGSPFSPERTFGPVPVAASVVSVDTRSDRILLVWHATGMSEPTANAYRREVGTEWTALARITPDGTEYLRYEDLAVQPGTRYGYRLGLRDREVEVFVGEVWAEVGAAQLALAGLRPNPAGPNPSVTFTLPDASPARLEVLDVGGRRILARDVGSLGPGTHVVSLDLQRPLPPGLYLLRLTHGDRAVTARSVVSR